jgi:hypothetical protein
MLSKYSPPGPSITIPDDLGTSLSKTELQEVTDAKNCPFNFMNVLVVSVCAYLCPLLPQLLPASTYNATPSGRGMHPSYGKKGYACADIRGDQHVYSKRQLAFH